MYVCVHCTVCKLAGERERLLALFSFTSGPTSDIIGEFVSTYQLPVLSVAPGVDQSVRQRLRRRQRRPAPAERQDPDETLHRQHETTTTTTVALHLRPLYTSAVVDVIQHYKWQHVFYVFDDDDGKHKHAQRSAAHH